MAEIPKQDRAAIKSDIALSRERLARELSGLRHELDFPRKIKSSFRNQPAIWIGTLVLVGLVLAVAPARRKKVYVQAGKSREKKNGEGRSILEAGALIAALKFAATLLRPVAVNFLTTKLRDYGSRRGRVSH
ncbi:MAG: hypothetical protein QOH24_52 [Verrucomicrobiota bacterium]|jgi:hypothetical protein